MKLTLEQKVERIINEVFKGIKEARLDNYPLFSPQCDRLDSAPDKRLVEQYEAYRTSEVEKLR